MVKSAIGMQFKPKTKENKVDINAEVDTIKAYANQNKINLTKTQES